MSPSLGRSFARATVISPLPNQTPGAESALQRYVLNDVTGRSELGVVGFKSGRILSGHTEPSAGGPSEARHPQAGAGGGVERALDWTSGTWGLVQLCLVGHVPRPLWASVFPSVKCRGVTRRPCMGAFQLRNSCVSKKSNLEFCCSSLWTSSGW